MRPSESGSRWLRVFAAAGLALLIVVGVGSPAAAHGGGGPDATNYETRVLDSGDPRLVWEVFSGDALLQLTNRTGEEVVIAGYEGEPYLRFTPGEGVFENVHSPAKYLNQDRYANSAPPAAADPDAAPEWRRVADGNEFAWHDHRAHWMSPVRPTEVDADPSVEHLVFAWSIPVTIGTGDVRQVEATGELRWMPPVPWWPPMLILGAVFCTITIIAAVRTRPEGSTWKGLSRPVTVMLWLVIAANVVRTIDDMVAAPATIGQQVWLGFISLLAIVAILGLSQRSWVGHAGGFAALAAAGVMTMLIFGGEASAQLSASQLVTVFPNWVRRWTIAGSYMILAPIVLAAILAAVNYKRYLDKNPTALRARAAARPSRSETTTPA